MTKRALVPAPAWTLPPQRQRLLLAAVARYLANGAGPSGTLLVLDDLQWAGVDALDLLESLLRTPGAQALRVVGAYRAAHGDRAYQEANELEAGDVCVVWR